MSLKKLYECPELFVGGPRAGVNIFLTASGNLKVVHHDLEDDDVVVCYVKADADFNEDTDWLAPWNDHANYLDYFLHALRDCKIYYRKVVLPR